MQWFLTKLPWSNPYPITPDLRRRGKWGVFVKSFHVDRLTNAGCSLDEAPLSHHDSLIHNRINYLQPHQGNLTMRFSIEFGFTRLLLPVLLLVPTIHAQVQILNVTTKEYPMLEARCLSVLNLVVNCDQAVTWAGRGRFEEDATLTTLCTAVCTSALTTWHQRVTAACTARFNDGAGFMVLPQLWSEQYLEEYNLVCLQHK